MKERRLNSWRMKAIGVCQDSAGQKDAKATRQQHEHPAAVEAFLLFQLLWIKDCKYSYLDIDRLISRYYMKGN